MRRAARHYDVTIAMAEPLKVFEILEDLPVDEIKLANGLTLHRHECRCAGSPNLCQRWVDPHDIVHTPE